MSLRLLAAACLVGCVTRTEIHNALDRDEDGYLPIEGGGPDCDETRPDINPGATEICGDDVDNDCDGYIDDVGIGERLWYRDVDGDGHGIDESVAACTEPEGYAPVSGDCDDDDPSIQPSAEDLCDGIDQDCDGIADDDASDLNQFLDEDGDGFGRDDIVVTGCGLTPGYVLLAGDCNDEVPDINPASEDVCDGVDQDCDGDIDEDVEFTRQYQDADSDGDGDPNVSQVACTTLVGFVPTSGDCDDADPTRNSQAVDFCDEIDQDCDGDLDDDAIFRLYYPDADEDGVGQDNGFVIDSCDPVPGYAPAHGDCDDNNPHISPNVQDTCDGVDSDCDGQIDDDALLTLYFPDLDGDGAGSDDPTTAVQACVPPPHHVQLTGDCNDADPTVHPTTLDTCDGVDSNCNGTADDDAHFELRWHDADGDGVGTGDPFLTCSSPAQTALVGGDCNDANPAIRPGQPDSCDDVDQDCDGAVDEDAHFELLWTDADGDGVGTGEPTLTCETPANTAPIGGDCNDGDPAIRPGLPDTCDDHDQDCDGAVDEDVHFELLWTDADDDGVGAGDPTFTCESPPHTASVGGDCNDHNPGVRPGIHDECDGTDQDCDGATDEDATFAVWFPDVDGDGAGANGVEVLTCDGPPPDHIAIAGDCDDTDPAVVVPQWWTDADGDGFGAGSPTNGCQPPPSTVDNGDDCDDGRALTRPTGTEVCRNFHDDDCDSLTSCRWPSFLPFTDADVVMQPDYNNFIVPIGDVNGDGWPDVGTLFFNADPEVFFNKGGDVFDFDHPDWQVNQHCFTTQLDVIGGPSPDLLCTHYPLNSVVFHEFDGTISNGGGISGMTSENGPSLIATPSGHLLHVEDEAGDIRIFETPATRVNYASYDRRIFDGWRVHGAVECESPSGCLILIKDGMFTLVPNTSGVDIREQDLHWTMDGRPGPITDDINGDGFTDLALLDSEELEAVFGPFDSAIEPTAVPLYLFPPETYQGYALAPDLDLDGVADWARLGNLLVGPGITDTIPSVEYSYGSADSPFFTGSPSTILYSEDGHNVFPIGSTDWNGDGFTDQVVVEFAIDDFNNVGVFYGTGQ